MSDQPSPAPQSSATTNLWLTGLVVVVPTALTLVNNRIAGLLKSTGSSWSPTDLQGPGALLQWDQTRERWAVLFSDNEVRQWLVGYGLLDVAFTLTYTTILWRWSLLVIADRSARGLPPWRQGLLGLCLVAGACDLLENLLVITGGSPSALMVCTAGKWAALIPALLTLVALGHKHVLPTLRGLRPASRR